MILGKLAKTGCWGVFILLFVGGMSRTMNSLVASAATLPATATSVIVSNLRAITPENVSHLSPLSTLLSPDGAEAPLMRAAWSPDGKKIAAVSTRGVWLFNLKNVKEPRLLTNNRVHSVYFAPDSASLLSLNLNGTVQRWDIETSRLGFTIGDNPRADGIMWSTSGANFVSWNVDEPSLRLWDGKTGKEEALLKGLVAPTAFSPNAKILAAASSEVDTSVRLYDLETKTAFTTFKEPEMVYGRITFIAFAPDSAMVAAGSRESIWLWDVTKREKRRILKADYYDGVIEGIFNSSGEILASWGRNKLYLWNLLIDSQQPLELKDFGFDRLGVTFNATGSLLASWDYVNDGDRVRLWDTTSGTMLFMLKNQTAASFNYNATVLLTLSNKGEIILWGV